MIPTAFGSYIVVQALGSGGMADVYLAADPRLDRRVAVKAPHEELLTNEVRARFAREARAAAALEHEAIVPIYDFGEQDGRPYLAMRYLTGGTLADRLERGPLSLHEALPVLRHIGAALDYAHARGIIHRDVKSANVLFDDEGNAFMADFGIAWMVSENTDETLTRLTSVGVVHGTMAYISPEQAMGKPLDGRSDVYSLGVVLFEMLTGDVPFKADSGIQQAVQHVSASIPEIRERRPELPEGIQAVISRVLAKQPEERYDSCAALVEDLQRVAMGQAPAIVPPPVPPPPVAPAEPPAPAGRPSNRLWLMAALAVIAIGVAVFALLRGTATGATGGETTIAETIVIETAPPEPTQPEPTTPVDTPTTPPEPTTETGTPPPEPTETAAPPTDEPTTAPPPSVPDEIVFQSNRDGDFEIYVMTTDGQNVRPLTDHDADDNFPRVSPDGQRILFVSERDGNEEVYVMNRDGSEQTRLTVDPADDRLPAWSPDGDEIVFASSRDGLMDIFIMNDDGRDVRQITDSLEREGHVSWSIHDELAYNASMELYWQLWASDADGANRRQITHSTYDEWSPEWSPDGEWLLFHSERDSRTNPGIYLMRPDGSDARLIHNGQGEEWGASWSADGMQIVFAVTQADDSDNLYIVDADGGNLRLLTERGSYPSWAIGAAATTVRAGEAISVKMAATPIPLAGDGLTRLTTGDAAHSSHYTAIFAPDQSRILLSVEMGDDWQVFDADPNGGGLRRQLTSGPYDHYQADLSPDGQFFLTSANRDGDGDIYLFDATTGDLLQQLTNAHALDYHPRWLPDGQSFIYSADDDGTGDDEIFLMTLDGRQTQLTDNETFDGFATPSRDGQYVTFYSGRGGDYEIYVMDIDGGNQRRLTTSPGRDASPSFSPDGRWVIFESERGGSYEIYAVPFEGGETTRITDSDGDNYFPVISPDGQWLMFQSTRGGDMDIYRQPWDK